MHEPETGDTFEVPNVHEGIKQATFNISGCKRTRKRDTTKNQISCI